jgi:chromosome segregation ATPase
LNKTTLPILIKSPPPLQSNNALLKQISPSSSDANKSSETTTANEVTSNQVLAAREAHIIKLNTANVKLQEENDNLTNECERLKYEFKITKSDLTGRLDASCNERDGYKKACADLQVELASLKTELADKEVQMEQLTSEGLKLSKQELNQSNIIKKLRSKEKEVETVVAGLKSDLDRTKKELQELKKTLEGKNEAEKQNLETFKKLEKGAALLEKELTDTKMNYEESMEKIKSLENTLQNSFK